VPPDATPTLPARWYKHPEVPPVDGFYFTIFPDGTCRYRVIVRKGHPVNAPDYQTLTKEELASRGIKVVSGVGAAWYGPVPEPKLIIQPRL
jgi:hypothetical protein